jgi:hypothetical protein
MWLHTLRRDKPKYQPSLYLRPQIPNKIGTIKELEKKIIKYSGIKRFKKLLFGEYVLEWHPNDRKGTLMIYTKSSYEKAYGYKKLSEIKSISQKTI